MLKVQDFSCLIFSFFKATLFFTTIASLLAVFQNCDQTETAFLLTALHVTLTQGQRQICTDWILRPCEHHIGPGWPIAFFISYFSQETPIEALKMVKFDFMVRRWGVWWDVWPQCGIIFTVHCVVLERKSERKSAKELRTRSNGKWMQQEVWKFGSSCPAKVRVKSSPFDNCS